ncbi:MAG: methylenetetrahydrofolate--tRNA-(uracil(54)-C(5))-methyltransferase (FADH(2)-oxidizing) TrmFO [Pseudomonadota bacterium]
MTGSRVRIIGAGLAGCEVAWQLARAGLEVELWEQKPLQRTPAQSNDGLAELVCSNSLRSDQLGNAVGLLKQELRLCRSGLMQCADHSRVPAGSALAVDRRQFSDQVESLLGSCPSLQIQRGVFTHLPDDGVATVLATGPLTQGPLAAQLAELTGGDALHFYDAIAPILETEGIDRSIVFAQSRYDRGDPEDYLNVPLDEEAYHLFVHALCAAPKVTPRDFEDSACFEGCLPVEVMAARGPLVLAFGPMKPVGLVDPRTGRRPFAAVQLRKEDPAGTARNMVGFQTRLTWPAQRELFSGLPGLAGVRFQRLGSMHRNSFLDAPRVLDDALRLHASPHPWVAGQLAGSEGYVEAIAVGMLVARSVLDHVADRSFLPPPPTTALGGLYRHLRDSSKPFGPSNVTWSMIQVETGGRGRGERRTRAAEHALTQVTTWRGQE